MLRTFFNALSQSSALRKMTRAFGPARRLTQRFIAGESVDQAIEVARALNAQGMGAILNHLGEGVATADDARRAALDYQRLVERIHTEGIRATISVKPTHLGLHIEPDLFVACMTEILQIARDHAVKANGHLAARIAVEIDIEDSGTTEKTVKAYHRLLDQFDNVRLALQAYLHRTAGDLEGIIARGGSVRLVKGAYDEPDRVAWRRKQDVDRSFALLTAKMLGSSRDAGFYPAIGTHDHLLIQKAIEQAGANQVDPLRYEFQMLLGVRRDWQKRLIEAGHQVRVYVPFGVEWYPYFMRRLAERPANALFMARAMLGK